MSEHTARQVGITELKVTYVLPEYFGQGWGYDLDHYRSDNSYDKSGNGNFAHEALKAAANNAKISANDEGIVSVEFVAKSIDEMQRGQQHLQYIVESFPPREPCDIYIKTWPGEEALVTSYAPTIHPGHNEPSQVKDMPFSAYVAKFIPMAELHPSLKGMDPEAVAREFDLEQIEKIGMPAVGDFKGARRTGG